MKQVVTQRYVRQPGSHLPKHREIGLLVRVGSDHPRPGGLLVRVARFLRATFLFVDATKDPVVQLQITRVDTPFVSSLKSKLISFVQSFSKQEAKIRTRGCLESDSIHTTRPTLAHSKKQKHDVKTHPQAVLASGPVHASEPVLVHDPVGLVALWCFSGIKNQRFLDRHRFR